MISKHEIEKGKKNKKKISEEGREKKRSEKVL